jgi:hypothetical protein
MNPFQSLTHPIAGSGTLGGGLPTNAPANTKTNHAGAGRSPFATLGIGATGPGSVGATAGAVAGGNDVILPPLGGGGDRPTAGDTSGVANPYASPNGLGNINPNSSYARTFQGSHTNPDQMASILQQFGITVQPGAGGWPVFIGRNGQRFQMDGAQHEMGTTGVGPNNPMGQFLTSQGVPLTLQPMMASYGSSQHVQNQPLNGNVPIKFPDDPRAWQPPGQPVAPPPPPADPGIDHNRDVGHGSHPAPGPTPEDNWAVNPPAPGGGPVISPNTPPPPGNGTGWGTNGTPADQALPVPPPPGQMIPPLQKPPDVIRPKPDTGGGMSMRPHPTIGGVVNPPSVGGTPRPPLGDVTPRAGVPSPFGATPQPLTPSQALTTTVPGAKTVVGGGGLARPSNMRTPRFGGMSATRANNPFGTAPQPRQPGTPLSSPNSVRSPFQLSGNNSF